MGRVRKLPIRTPPLPGESYASYIERFGRDVHAPISAVLFAFGVIDEELDRAIGSGYGIALHRERIEAMAFALDLTPERVGELFLSHYDGRVIDLSGLDLADRSSSRKIALREWAYFSGTHACPECLGETGGAWQLRWKFPWSFACVKHSRLLADSCPDCKRRIGMSRQDGSSRPRFISRIPTPGHCANAQAPGVAAVGLAAEPCGFPLSSVHTESLAGGDSTGAAVGIRGAGRLIKAQRLLDSAMDSERVVSLGEEVATLDYFRELRSIVSFLLSVIEVEDVSAFCVPSVENRVRRYVEERDGIRQDRRDAGAGWRNASRQRFYVGVPDSALLLAGVLPIAVELLETPSEAALGRSLGTYIERFRRLRSGSRGHLDYFGFSERLGRAVDLYMSRYAKTTTTLGMKRVKQGASSTSKASAGGASAGQVSAGQVSAGGASGDFGELTVANIPQLFFREDYERDLKPLLIASDSRYARRVCSMWAVKALTRCDWKDAAEVLCLPVDQTIGLKTRLLHSLNRDGHTEAFDRHIRAVMRRIGSDPLRVDYQERREALSGLVEIEWDEWKTICEAAGVAPGKRGGKNRQAAAWLWAELMSSDHLFSPTFQQSDTTNDREYFRRFVKRDLPKLNHELRQYGKKVFS